MINGLNKLLLTLIYSIDIITEKTSSFNEQVVTVLLSGQNAF